MKYVKKPIPVEGIQIPELTAEGMFVDNAGELQTGLVFVFENEKACVLTPDFTNDRWKVKTMEGVMSGKPGDFLMQGIRGEFYICDKQIHADSYTEYTNTGTE